jgi:predicted transcriptional regulator
VGLVQHHLGVLSGAGLVTSRRGRRYRRFFASGVFSEREMDVISALRNETAKQIVSMFLERLGMLHGELASELGVTSQAVTWQMGNLKALGIVEEENGSTNKHYIVSLDQLQMIQNCMNIL